MQAAVITETKVPIYGAFDDPVAADGAVVATVRAAALTNLDIAIAEGRHYFSPKMQPFVLGREAVAVTPDGRRCWYNLHGVVFPYGSMAERTLLRPEFGLLVPDEADDVTAAALGNAGLAGWLPLSWRAHMVKGETVLVIGATGASGLIAVAAARLLGAGRIVAAGRSPEALAKAKSLGAHATVNLTDTDDLQAAFREAGEGGFDIVVDYLNGKPAETALQVMNTHGRIVQIGNTLSPGTLVHAQTARKFSLDVLGFAYYHAPLDQQRNAYAALCRHASTGDIAVDATPMKLVDINEAWTRQKAGSRTRLVMVP